jgi:hypothetical protein
MSKFLIIVVVSTDDFWTKVFLQREKILDMERIIYMRDAYDTGVNDSQKHVGREDGMICMGKLFFSTNLNYVCADNLPSEPYSILSCQITRLTNKIVEFALVLTPDHAAWRQIASALKRASIAQEIVFVRRAVRALSQTFLGLCNSLICFIYIGKNRWKGCRCNKPKRKGGFSQKSSGEVRCKSDLCPCRQAERLAPVIFEMCLFQFILVIANANRGFATVVLSILPQSFIIIQHLKYSHRIPCMNTVIQRGEMKVN